MHVAFRGLEFRIAQIAPEDTGHSQFVRVSKRVRDFGDLASRLIRTEIDSRAHRHGAEVLSLFHSSKHYLIEFVRKGQQLVMIYFYYERNLMSIPAGDDPQDAKG